MLIHAFNGIRLDILNTFFHQCVKSPEVSICGFFPL